MTSFSTLFYQSGALRFRTYALYNQELAPITSELFHELGHIMLKPELFDGRMSLTDLFLLKRKIELALQKGGMQIVVPWKQLILPEDLVRKIYGNTFPSIDTWHNRIETFYTRETGHVLFFGQFASTYGTVLRGRVSCRGNCYTEFSNSLPTDYSYPDIYRNCPTSNQKVFGQGCGIRGELATSGVLHADADQPDTIWNGIHSASPGDLYVGELYEYLKGPTN